MCAMITLHSSMEDIYIFNKSSAGIIKDHHKILLKLHCAVEYVPAEIKIPRAWIYYYTVGSLQSPRCVLVNSFPYHIQFA